MRRPIGRSLFRISESTYDDMRYNETVYKYVLLRLRVEYIGNEDMPCVGGSMSTFLGVCDDGTELLTKITDRASWAGVAAAL